MLPHSAEGLLWISCGCFLQMQMQSCIRLFLLHFHGSSSSLPRFFFFTSTILLLHFHGSSSSLPRFFFFTSTVLLLHFHGPSSSLPQSFFTSTVFHLRFHGSSPSLPRFFFFTSTVACIGQPLVPPVWAQDLVDMGFSQFRMVLISNISFLDSLSFCRELMGL